VDRLGATEAFSDDGVEFGDARLIEASAL